MGVMQRYTQPCLLEAAAEQEHGGDDLLVAEALPATLGDDERDGLPQVRLPRGLALFTLFCIQNTR
jgi:hypothetical protein